MWMTWILLGSILYMLSLSHFHNWYYDTHRQYSSRWWWYW